MELSTQNFINLLKYLEFETTAAILISIGGFIIFGILVAIKAGFNKLDFGDALPIILSTYSVLGGLRVIIFGLENVAKSMDATQRLYIVIGGCAVIWNGCRTIRKKVNSIPNRKDKGEQ